MTKEVFLLVGISYLHVEGRKMRHRLDELYRTDKEKAIALNKEYRASKEFVSHIGSSTVLKGIFETQKEAIDFLQENQNHIHEGAYYTYFVIEKRYFGYEGYSFFEVDPELWFEGQSCGSDWHDYKYVQCEKPEFYKGIIGFA